METQNNVNEWKVSLNIDIVKTLPVTFLIIFKCELKVHNTHHKMSVFGSQVEKYNQ